MALNTNGYASPISKFANEVVHMLSLYFAPGEAATSPITKLPNEIVHMIFAYLTPEEAANLRLLSKDMAAVGLQYLVPTVHLHLEEDCLNKLLDIAGHPVASKHVYELVYEVDRLESLSWEDWSRRIIGAGYNSWEYRGPPESPGANASAAAMQAYSEELETYFSTPVHRYSQEKIHQEWHQYGEAYIRQWNICYSSSLSRELEDALAKLPNLRSVRTSSQNTMTRWMEGFTQRLGASWDHDALVLDLPMAPWKVGLCSTLSVLRALGHRNLPVTKLDLSSLNWQLLAQDERDFMLVKKSFRHLKYLSICFTGRATVRYGFSSVRAELWDSKTFELIKEDGRLLELFSAAPDLEALTISFSSCDITMAISLEDVFGKFHWNSLKTIRLVAFEASENEMLDFLNRHANSLQSVSIADIDLRDGTWSTTLHRMRQMLKLKHAQVSWELTDDHTVWAMKTEVKIWNEERKVFVSSCLGNLVGQYLLEHDKEDLTFEAYLTSLRIDSLEEVLEN